MIYDTHTQARMHIVLRLKKVYIIFGFFSSRLPWFFVIVLGNKNSRTKINCRVRNKTDWKRFIRDYSVFRVEIYTSANIVCTPPNRSAYNQTNNLTNMYRHFVFNIFFRTESVQISHCSCTSNYLQNIFEYSSEIFYRFAVFMLYGMFDFIFNYCLSNIYRKIIQIFCLKNVLCWEFIPFFY